MNWESIVGFIQIIVINLALSGDNVIVIGMAAASLPHSQRNKAIIFGGTAAIILRILLTVIATTLMKIPLISAIAGAVLCWVAWKLLRMDIEAEDEDDTKKCKQANSLKQAIIIILMADFLMSLDNVLAVAGAAHGDYVLLIVGLLLSMPLLFCTGAFISNLIDRFSWIPFIGAAFICFTAMRMILGDQFIEPYLHFGETLSIIISVVFGLLVPTLILLYNKRKAAGVARNCKPEAKTPSAEK